MKRRLLALLLLAACGDTGRARVEIPLSGSGVAPRSVALGEAVLTLTRADVGFGPAYFCASEAGRAELCEVALAELRETVMVHALDPAAQTLGVMQGTSGEVRSAIYDLGITWLLTENQPRALPNAPEGHGVILEGQLARGAQSLHFRAAIDIPPRTRGDAAINAQRTRATIDEAGARLALAIDPHAWVDRLDVDALFALDGDGDGFVEIDPGSPSYESIVQGIVSRAPVRFDWQAP